MDSDRGRWNAKWRERAGELEQPASFVLEHAHLLPVHGRALDVAGGGGRHAVWLARRGLDVTMIDVSDVGIARAERRAADAGLSSKLRFLQEDLDTAELPAPVFDLVMMVHYLNRARRDELARLAFVDGVVLVTQPTVKNLERHAGPRREYLVEEGELAGWLESLGFELLVSREGWNAEGRHEAELIARRRDTPVPPAEPEQPPPSDGPYR